MRLSEKEDLLYLQDRDSYCALLGRFCVNPKSLFWTKVDISPWAIFHQLMTIFLATSAVDLDTDQAIQDIIRGPAFTDVTILTIAHRLNTIIESDRVLVMEAGKVYFPWRVTFV